MTYVSFNTTVKSKATDSSKIPVTDGQFLIVTDTKQLMYDFGTTRIVLGDIIELDTEAQRAALITPLDKFYFVKDTKVLWRYTSGSWQKWADGETVSQHIESDILSESGSHGLRYNNTRKIFELYDKDAEAWFAASQSGSTDSAYLNLTLSANAWENNLQTVAVAGVKAESNGILGFPQNISPEQSEAASLAQIRISGQADGMLTFAMTGTVPTIDIPVSLILVSPEELLDAVTISLKATAWVDGAQTVSVAGLSAAQNGVLGLAQDITDEEMTVVYAAGLMICSQANNSITIRATGIVPTVDLDVVLIPLS